MVFTVPSCSSSYSSTNSGTTFSTSLATTPISFDLFDFLVKCTPLSFLTLSKAFSITYISSFNAKSEYAPTLP